MMTWTAGKRLKRRIDTIMSFLTVTGVLFIVLFIKGTLHLSSENLRTLVWVAGITMLVVLPIFLIILNKWLKPIYGFIDGELTPEQFKKRRIDKTTIATQALQYPVKHITASIICWNFATLLVSIICSFLDTLRFEEIVVLTNTVFIFSIFTNMMAYKYAMEVIPPVMQKLTADGSNIDFLPHGTIAPIRKKLLIFLTGLLLFLILFSLQLNAISTLTNAKGLLFDIALIKIKNISAHLESRIFKGDLLDQSTIDMRDVGEEVLGLDQYFIADDRGTILYGAAHDQVQAEIKYFQTHGKQRQTPLFAPSYCLYSSKRGIIVGVRCSWRAFNLQLIPFSGWYLFFVSFMMLLAILLGRFIARDIASSLTEVNVSMQEISQGRADLTRRIVAWSSFETVELATWFNRFIEHLAELIGRIQSLSSNIYESARHMYSRSDDFINEGRRQNQNVNDVLNATKMYKKYRKSLGNYTSDVQGKSDEAFETAKTGLIMLNSIFDKVDVIRTTSESNTTVLEQLYEKSLAINDIMAQVDKLADQTRLLSFNAMLESVSAGEKGTRFSIIAEEIRELANNVSTSTTEIKSRVGEISGTINELVYHYNREGTEIAQLHHTLEETSGEFQKIVTISETTTQSISHLIAEIESQQLIVEQTTTTIDSLMKSTHSIVEIGSDFQTIIGRLTSMLDDYEKQIKAFRVIKNDFD